jgi:hypothetical protein
MAKPDRYKTAETPNPSERFIAHCGLNYDCTAENPDGVRVEAGGEVPARVVQASPWLIEQGIVAPASSATSNQEGE